jgi:hypothetical protein
VAVEDALAVVLSDWTDIEPLLTVRELTELADIGWGTMRGAGSGRSAAVFSVVAEALPPDHAAWPALQARFDPGSSPIPVIAVDVELIDRAVAALASPMSTVDAAADALAEESSAGLLRFGAVPADREAAEGEFWLSVRVGGEAFYPLFQFESTGPYRQYEIVARLRSQLDADEDPAGAAAWWLTSNPWLSARPADLLGTGREGEIAYAADQLANDSW